MYSEMQSEGKVALVFEDIQDMLDFGRLLDRAKYDCEGKNNREQARFISKCVTPQMLARARQEFRSRMAAKGHPRFVCGEKQ